MIRRKSAFFVLVMALLPVRVAGQGTTLDRYKEDVSKWDWAGRHVSLIFEGDPKPLTEVSGGLWGNLECDSNGAVYVRRQQVRASDFQSPILRLSPSDPTVTFFVPRSEFEGEVYGFAFTVDVGGKVFELVRAGKADRVFLVEFSKDGQFQKKTEIESNIRPVSIAALPSDRLLVRGIEETADRSQGKSVTAIFRSDGKLLTRFASANNATKEDIAAIELGDARVGDDQNIYALHSASPPVVTVYDLSGHRLREMRLRPPFSNAHSSGIYPSSYRMIVSYQQATGPKEAPRGLPVFSVYNAETGELLTSYVQESRGIVACVVQNEATILTTTSDKHFAILRVKFP